MTINTQIDRDVVRETIAFNLSAVLKSQRWTGRAAAAALGLSQPYVSRRMTGDVDLSGSDLALFAGFLDVPVARFFEPVPDVVGGGNGQIIGIRAARSWQPLVGPTGLEPMTSTVEDGRLAPVTPINRWAA